MSTKTVTDELDSITRMLCEKYTDRTEAEMRSLVHGVYTTLLSKATVTAHLIPLTVNRCQRMLKAQRHTADKGLEAVDLTTLAS